ncbi:SNARE-binding exocyst subunit S6 [Cladochytrium tenue]|nr:SNARE-binding exocyst subunit S6 [Cladochytrium tenue]
MAGPPADGGGGRQLGDLEVAAPAADDTGGDGGGGGSTAAAPADNPYRVQALARIRSSALDGFVRLSRRCCGLLVDMALRDVVPVLVKFHCAEWYDGGSAGDSSGGGGGGGGDDAAGGGPVPLVRFVVGTLDDYLSDFQEHMNEYLFSKLASELQERLAVLHLEAFRNKGAKFRSSAGGDDGPGAAAAAARIRADIDAIADLFGRYRSAKRARAAQDPVLRVAALIEANPRLVFLDFYTLWKAYPDVPMAYVEEVLGRRDDLDRAALRETMEQCRSKVQEEREKNPGKEWPVTLFSKLASK